MKVLLRSLVRSVLFKNHEGKQFVPIVMSSEEIRERVFLMIGNREIDISQRHSIVCHLPFLIAVYLTHDEIPTPNSNSMVMAIRREQDVNARVSVLQKMSIEIGKDIIAIFEASGARCHQLNAIYQFILLKRYFLYKKKDTFLQGKMYAAMYSYPRPIVAISLRRKDHSNIFPIDFQFFVESCNLFLFSIQTSNSELSRILQGKKIVISDTASATSETIYWLGKNIRSSKSNTDTLSFDVSSSEIFKFPVPGFSTSYKEIEIVRHIDLGTHTLIMGTVVNERRTTAGNSFLCHIHFFQFVGGGYGHLAVE